MLSNELQGIIHGIKSPIKSFRVVALEDLIRYGENKEILPILYSSRKTEIDKECIRLLDQAINVASGKIKPGEVKLSKEDGGFVSMWKNANDEHRLNMLGALPARLPKSLKEIGPELLETTNDPVVEARVIRVFCRNWPEDKLPMIVSRIDSESLVLKLAALRTFIHIKPECLVEKLPALLSSDDPQIKALSIRALAKIDNEEALKYLQALLLSNKETERMAGLQNCFFFPFGTIKPILLKFFSAETEPELIKQAGLITDMNPDLNVPFHLYEIAERSPEKKSILIKNIFNNALKHLKSSGILGENFGKYTAKLQDWVGKRNALRFVKQIVELLDIPSIPDNLDRHIRTHLNNKYVLFAFNEALKWPISTTAKNNLAFYLNAEKSINDAEKEPIQPAEEKKSDEEDISSETLVKQVLDRNNSIEIKIAAINKMAECKLGGLEDIAVRIISSSNTNYELIASAIEYLGAVDPERVFPYFGKCLKTLDAGVRSSALQILKNYDFNQAMSYLKAMLYSPDIRQQNMAMQCMDQFDFELVRDLLTDYMCRCEDENLLDSGLLHFAANPSPENVYSLYKIEQSHTGKIAEQARILRNNCPESVENIEEKPKLDEKTIERQIVKPETNVIKKDDELKSRLTEEKSKKLLKKPAYAFKEEKKRVTTQEHIMDVLFTISNWVGARKKGASFIVFFVVAYFSWIVFAPSNAAANTGGTGAVIAAQNVREGTVDDVKNDKAIFITPQNEKLILSPLSDGYKIPDIGSKLRISFVPFRKYGDGSLVVRIRSMVLIDSFTKEFSGVAR